MVRGPDERGAVRAAALRLSPRAPGRAHRGTGSREGEVTAAPRCVTTDEQRAWLSAARRCGERCAACGRPLAADEPVYVEHFMLTLMVPVEASIGAECASSGLLAETGGRDPERCAGCCRPIYY